MRGDDDSESDRHPLRRSTTLDTVDGDLGVDCRRVYRGHSTAAGDSLVSSVIDLCEGPSFWPADRCDGCGRPAIRLCRFRSLRSMPRGDLPIVLADHHGEFRCDRQRSDGDRELRE